MGKPVPKYLFSYDFIGIEIAIGIEYLLHIKPRTFTGCFCCLLRCARDGMKIYGNRIKTILLFQISVCKKQQFQVVINDSQIMQNKIR